MVLDDLDGRRGGGRGEPLGGTLGRSVFGA